MQLAANVKGWWMQPDGRYTRPERDGREPLRSQDRLRDLVAAWPNEPMA